MFRPPSPYYIILLPPTPIFLFSSLLLEMIYIYCYTEAWYRFSKEKAEFSRPDKLLMIFAFFHGILMKFPFFPLSFDKIALFILFSQSLGKNPSFPLIFCQKSRNFYNLLPKFTHFPQSFVKIVYFP